MLKMQRTAAMGIRSRVVSGRIWKHVRMIEKWPSFINTPACSILVAAGAAACPTGDQECSGQIGTIEDRKSTRLNSSHVRISYAVFCLKKKKKGQNQIPRMRRTRA